MVQFARWTQNVMSGCNMDISLENSLISEEAHFDAETHTLRKCYIKFIDFEESDAGVKWRCTKYVGKTYIEVKFGA